jgi:hypothetical protein
MFILKAGMTGCLAGLMIPNATIVDDESEPRSHKALLRFRSPQIGELLGVEFKKVKVSKGIWYKDKYVEPSILMNNLYSQKVADKILSRSIEDLETVERYICDDLHAMMIDALGSRIRCDVPLMPVILGCQTVISTVSIFDMAKMVDIKSGSVIQALGAAQNLSNPIYVSKFMIDDCDVYQTVYFPDPDTTMYRATLEGDVLTVETMEPINDVEISMALAAFGISSADNIVIDFKQKIGKMAPLPNDVRKRFIRDLTTNHNVFSLGRVATWREKVLLDDCYHDVNVIRKLINADQYDRARSEV